MSRAASPGSQKQDKPQGLWSNSTPEDQTPGVPENVPATAQKLPKTTPR